MRVALLLTAVVSTGVLAAESPEPDGVDLQARQVELLRAELAGQLQLQAAELIDELVYGWTQAPPAAEPLSVVLAGVSVPVGLGTGLEAFLENHLSGLLVKNERTHVQLVHCPACNAWVVHSAKNGTTVARGFDDPATIADAAKASGTTHALFLDFETEGSALVLRARLTKLDASLRIVFSRTLTTSTSVPALLRDGERLTSAAEARKEYLSMLGGRGLFLVPVRFGMRTYAQGTQATFGTTPLLWVSTGLEASFSQARAWTASINAGFSWLPQSHVAVMGFGRISRLLFADTTSLVWPDLYFFLGAGVFWGQGRGIATISNELSTVDDVFRSNTNEEPRRTLGLIHVGLELRVKNRVSVIFFLESLPGIESDASIGRYLDLGIIRFQSIGVEASFCF